MTPDQVLSQFQATACALMFAASIPLVFVGMLIAPKRKNVHAGGWVVATLTWDHDHPGAWANWAALFAAISTPPFIYLVGPSIIRSLNAVGFVVDMG